MNAQAVSWRRAVAVIAATVAAVIGIVVITRSDGLPALDATTGRATHWFAHRPSGRIVLVDGYAGRALARIDAEATATALSVAEGRSGAYVLDEGTAQARAIDTAGLVLGPETAVATLAAGSVTGVGTAGLVVVDPAEGQGAVVSPQGETIPFEVAATPSSLVAPDGAVWTVEGDDLVRTTSAGSQSTRIVAGAELTLAGNDAVVLDRRGRRARFDDGRWITIPDGPDVSELALQEPGVSSTCAWVGGGDALWCVGRDGVETELTVPGLDVTAVDRLAISDVVGVVVRGAPQGIVRFDPVGGTILTDAQTAAVDADAELAVSVTSGLVFVDDVDGDFVWAVSPWTVEAIDKNADGTLDVDAAGDVVDAGSSSGDGDGEVTIGSGDEPGDAERLPDNDGIDDPPIAVDDPVRARAGANVLVAVTANDYDPDGEAVAVTAVGSPTRGTAEIGNAATVTYQPDPRFVGSDEFEYTIVDGDGTPATAKVIVELIPLDAVNQGPVGMDDRSETADGASVIIDVLANDSDPERDTLRLASFTSPESGTVTETEGPSGLPALQYEPELGATGSVSFTYRPVDSYGAVGRSATVTVQIAATGADNRAPVTRPDAARVRRNRTAIMPVLANDRDPDGDPLVVRVRDRPRGVRVRVQGNDLEVTPLAGAAATVPFTYEVDDGRGGTAVGHVLVAVVDEDEPNRAPLAAADTATAVAGVERLIDVLENDTDPDGDPLAVVEVTQPADRSGQVTIVDGRRVRFVPSTAPAGEDEPRSTRFTYVVTDGRGHSVPAEVSVRILPEAIADAPFARDDAATTTVDVPVTIDVLRNDGSPTGAPPSLVGTPNCVNGGTANVTADARVRFDPPRGDVGVFKCSYEVTNASGARASATIVVTVEQRTSNEPPVVGDIIGFMAAGEVATFDLLSTATDPDGTVDRLRVVWSDESQPGASRDGRFLRYEAPLTAETVSILFRVEDARGGVTTGRLLITVAEATAAPTATPMSRTVQVLGQSHPFDLTNAVSDPDGPTAELKLHDIDVRGDDATAQRLNSLTVVVTPDPTFVGTIVVDYVIIDGDGLTAASTLTLVVEQPPNRPPVAVDDVAQVANGGTLVVDVLFNDSELDQQPLSLRIVSGAEQRTGSAVVRDQRITFTATPGESGTAAIRYEISDGELSAQATLNITVLPCPESYPDAPDVALQTGYMQPIFVDLTQYARNGQVVDVQPPLAGGTSGTITPPAGENGLITIDYAVRNSCRQRDAGRVTIDVNQEPLARPYAVVLGRREERTVPVTDLASDAEPLQIVSLAGAPSWVSITGDGSAVTLAPSGAVLPPTQFDLTVEDPGGLRVVVPVTVEVTNAAPIANADAVDASQGRTVFEPLANDFDPDGDPISLLSVPDGVELSDGSTADLEVLANGSIEVDPGNGGGAGSFQYTIQDDLGLVSAPAIVTVRVNRAPRADDVVAVLTPGSTTSLTLDASDPDGDPLTVTLRAVPPELTVTVSGLVVTITVPPDPTRFTYEFQYEVMDPSGATATAAVQLAVVPPTTTTVPGGPGGGPPGGGPPGGGPPGPPGGG